MNTLLRLGFPLINNQIIFIMTRIFSLLSAVKIFNNVDINVSTKMLLVYLASILLFPFISMDYINDDLSFLNFILFFLDQVLIGVILGLLLQFLIASVTLIGEIISNQIGLSFSVFFDLERRIYFPVISYLLNILFLFSFLVHNGHLYMIVLFIRSFDISLLNRFSVYRHIFLSLFNFSNIIFFNGIYFSLPILSFFLILYITFMVLNRLLPNVSLFSFYSIIVFFLGMILLYYFIYNFYFLSEIMIFNLLDYAKNYIFK